MHRKIIAAVIALLMLATTLSSIHAQAIVNTPDRLAYVTNDYRLMLYDPVERTETQLLENVGSFALGRDGRVAFVRHGDNDPDIYVVDPAAPALEPINITQNQAATHYPLAWSPDGRYLLFRSYQSVEDQSLYVWDGESIIDVMPDEPLTIARTFYADWSDDGRLAYTIEYDYAANIPQEIYLWDGNSTVSLSQNPDGADRSLRWSSDGQLMFVSVRNGEYGVYVWDGVSFNDGLPAVDSFVRIPPELQPNNPVWTDDQLIAFAPPPTVSIPESGNVIVWSPETESIVRRYPITSNDVMSVLAEGGQFIFSRHLAFGSGIALLDIQNTEGEIVFSVHTGESSWSPSGFLAYCGIDDRVDWVLSIWDGQESWEVASVISGSAQWQNGREPFLCSNI